MGVEGLRAGEKIASGSAIVLLISMFLDWFVIEIPDTTGVDFFLDGTGQSAWDSFEYTPIVLAVAIVAALAVAGLRLAGFATRALRPANALVAVLGLIAVLLIVYRIMDPPSVGGSFRGFFGTAVSAGRTVQVGIFLGLLGAVGISFGGCRAAVGEGRVLGHHESLEIND